MKTIPRPSRAPRTLSLLAALAALLVAGATPKAIAAPPQDGRYRGNLTLRVMVEGTKAEVRKVIPVAGILTGENLQLVLPELPEIPGFFTSPTFNCVVADGSVIMRPNNNALSFHLDDVKTTRVAIRGSVDFGTIPTPTGSGSARRFIELNVIRVGN